MTRNFDRPTDVYRLYSDGVLLYVGISFNAHYRFKQHTKREWWPRVDYVQIFRYSKRSTAEAHEAKAIRDEHPIYNVDPGTWQARAARFHPWADEIDYDEYPIGGGVFAYQDDEAGVLAL